MTPEHVTSLQTILEVLSGPVDVRGSRERSVAAVRHDSRRVVAGDLYVAVNDRDDRGVEFLPAALANGAAVVVADAPELMPAGLLDGSLATLLLVEDARRAMAEIAHAIHGDPARDMTLLAVTGTNGKTTTAYVLRQLLAAAGRKVGLIGTLGVMIDGEFVPTGYTTPESPELAELLAGMAAADRDTVVMEASSHALYLKRVAGLDYAGAIFTNLTQDHLDFHRSMEEYRAAKKILFDGLGSGSVAVVNVDDASGEAMLADTRARAIRYGADRSAEARISDVRLAADGSSWSLTLPDALGGGAMSLTTSLVGSFNVWNVTSAVALALALGIDRALLVEATARLRAVPGRMESIRLGNGVTAIVDYAHTPDALENVLRSARGLNPDGSIAVVFGCGGDRDRGKRPVMGELAARLADRVVVTSDNPRSESAEEIIREIMAGIECGSNVEPIVDRERAIGHALESARPGELVVIAGKGHETYQIIGSERRHFDDREVVRAWAARHAGAIDEVTAE